MNACCLKEVRDTNKLQYALLRSLNSFLGTMLYTSGQYILAFREHDDEKAALLRRLLKNLWSSLQSVIQDLKAPNTSAAYYTFFKDAKNIPFLTSLYTNITAGAPVYAPTSPPQPWAPFSPNGSPVIMVLSGKGQFSAAPNGYQEDMFDRCINNPQLTASVPFGKEQSSPFILLCPFFFTALSPSIYGDLPPEPFYEHPAANCLTVTKRNRFKKTTNRLQPAGFDLTQYRMWILLEELAHLYYSASTGNPSIDSYDVNKCVRLSPEASLSNGPSYSYYAASEYSLLSSILLTKRRTDTDGYCAKAWQANATSFQHLDARIMGSNFLRLMATKMTIQMTRPITELKLLKHTRMLQASPITSSPQILQFCTPSREPA